MKRNNKKGFTLAELLIVVAIIAVLVAVAIPVFTGQLQKAKESADEANIRSAYAAAVTAQLTDESAYPSAYDSGTFGKLNYSSKLSWNGGSAGLSVTYDASKIDDLSLKGGTID